MTDEEKNILTLNSFFLIFSETTHCPYLDINFNCYLFQTKSAADSFISNANNSLCIHESKQYVLKDFWNLYNQGAQGLQVFLRGKNTAIEIKLLQEDVKSAYMQYYNNETNGNLIRLQQTAEREYLIALASGTFFTPVKIDVRAVKEYPYLHYSYATFRDSTQYFLLFSTLQEYELWASKQEEPWAPMEISINKFRRIRGKNPVLINPLSNRLILPHKLLKQAVNPEKKEVSVDAIFAKN